MSVERLMAVCGHAISVCRGAAVEFKKAGLMADAALQEVTARALEVELRNAFATPEQIPVSRDSYLSRLPTEDPSDDPDSSKASWIQTETVHWAVVMLREGRERGIELREIAELFATDIETVARFDDWLRRLDQGPP